ncbi:unnamed protein product [Pseudo-nitzschia multistriata]|uniref:Ataxin-10 domain-containing protein n=1 Tax=Pseudo-nitzschia multistriata TaxID=183589 RepID=A0A448ZJX9_9STRA|nr:unnamed protein product [Pseudo-nitzschia multistriata]
MNLFSTRTGNDRVNSGSILVLAGFPILLSGQVALGVLTILVALVLTASQGITEADKIEIRFNASTPENVLRELEQLSEMENVNGFGKSNNSRKTLLVDEETRIKHYVKGLLALGRKYGKSSDDKPQLSLRYQQLAFETIRLYPENDQIVDGSISLLALIAKEPIVRKRYKDQAHEFGLNRPISVLKSVLARARNEEDEAKEEMLAEILRKGCLFLGAVCNESEDLGLSSVVLSKGGLELILEAAKWFRLHEEVSNWALWAIFTLSYDQLSIKARLVRLQGIQTICGIMENNQTSLEVTRHGTAILFDLLRERERVTVGFKWNPWEVRKIALASGLHERILAGMREFPDSMDIMKMGQEMLIGTGYRGDIPKFQEI